MQVYLRTTYTVFGFNLMDLKKIVCCAKQIRSIIVLQYTNYSINIASHCLLCQEDLPVPSWNGFPRYFGATGDTAVPTEHLQTIILGLQPAGRP